MLHHNTCRLSSSDLYKSWAWHSSGSIKSGAQTSDNNPAARHHEQRATREKRARESVEKHKEAAENFGEKENLEKAAAEKEKAYM